MWDFIQNRINLVRWTAFDNLSLRLIYMLLSCPVMSLDSRSTHIIAFVCWYFLFIYLRYKSKPRTNTSELADFRLIMQTLETITMKTNAWVLLAADAINFPPGIFEPPVDCQTDSQHEKLLQEKITDEASQQCLNPKTILMVGAVTQNIRHLIA